MKTLDLRVTIITRLFIGIAIGAGVHLVDPYLPVHLFGSGRRLVIGALVFGIVFAFLQPIAQKLVGSKT